MLFPKRIQCTCSVNFRKFSVISGNTQYSLKFALCCCGGEISWDLSLTHWGRATHICVGKLTTVGSDNGLSPGRRQAVIWTNAGILLIGPLGTNFSEILIGIQTFSLKEMHLKMSSGKWRSFCLGLNVLRWVSDGNLILHNRTPSLQK